MAQRGGKRPGAGRPKGSLDKATVTAKATLAEIARSYADEALEILMKIARSSESDAARCTAVGHILDRGYGKPMQGLEHSGKDGAPLAPPVIQFVRDADPA